MPKSNKITIKAIPKQKKALKKGLINAILYGSQVKNIAFCLKASDFSRVFQEAGETQVIEIQFEDTKKEALIHDLQYHPLTGMPIHVDFYAFKRGKEINVKVPVEFVGIAPAVKNLGGIFIINTREVEVRCQADIIPKKLTADISTLTKINDEIKIKDITFPKGVTPVQNIETVIASIVPPRQEEVKQASEATVSASDVSGPTGSPTTKTDTTNFSTGSVK